MIKTLEKLNQIYTFINENFKNLDVLYEDNTYTIMPEYWTLVALKILQVDKYIRYKLHYVTIDMPYELLAHIRLWREKQNILEFNGYDRNLLIQHTGPWIFKNDLTTPDVNITTTDELQLALAKNLIVHEKYGKICFDSEHKKFYRAKQDEPFELMAPEHILAICIENPHKELQNFLFRLNKSEFDLIKQAGPYFPEIPNEVKLNLLQICVDRLAINISIEQLIQAKTMQSSLDLNLNQTLDLIRSYNLKIRPLDDPNDLPTL